MVSSAKVTVAALPTSREKPTKISSARAMASVTASLSIEWSIAFLASRKTASATSAPRSWICSASTFGARLGKRD